MKYRSEIDGLRAIAVIPVIFFHAGFETFSGGFVGVDIFFVISGYLITSIILTEIDQGTFSILNFYERRARRILPALFLIMLVSILLAWLSLLPLDMKDFSQSLIAVSSFSSNIFFWTEADYWDIDNELKPLVHTWSLAVEEQYYIIFPLFMMLMNKTSKRWIFASFFVLAGVSLALAQWGAYNQPIAAFYLLPTRAWELAIGACISFFVLYRKKALILLLSNKYINELFGLVGLFLICYAIFVFDKKTPFPSIYTLIPTIGTGLIIVFSSTQTMIGRFLSTKALVTIGLISYSAYLWHQPLFAFSRYLSFPSPTPLVFVALIFCTFFLAYLTTKFVEQPFRKKHLFKTRKIFVFSIIGSLSFIIIGIAGHLFDGFNQRNWYTKLLIINYQPENQILQKQSWQLLDEIRNKSGDDSYSGNDFYKQSWFKNNNPHSKLLVIGNSHSKDMYNTLVNSQFAKENFQIARYPTQIAFLKSKSAELYSTLNYKESDIVMIATRFIFNDYRELETVVRKLLADNKKVVIVRNVFEFDFFANKTLADNMLQDKYLNSYTSNNNDSVSIVNDINKAYFNNFTAQDTPPTDRSSYISKANMVIDAVAKKYNEIIVLDRMDFICNKAEEKCFSINEQFEKYIYDYGHHTLEGAVFFGNRVDQINWLNPLINK